MTVLCPVCDRAFDTELGVKLHRKLDSYCRMLAERPRMSRQSDISILQLGLGDVSEL